MRFSPRLYAQHLGWTFKKHWQVQGKRIPNFTGASNELEKLGIIIRDPQEVLKPNLNEHFEVILNSEPTVKDETHSQRHEQKCHIYGNSNVLLEGMKQAQVLTKTVEVVGLPKTLEDLLSKTQLPSGVDRNVQQIILTSNVLDAEQTKLAKIKSPDRPAYNFSREYGISPLRRNRLLVNRLLMECEKAASRTTTSRRRIIDQADFVVTVAKDGDLFQLNVTTDKMVTATKPIEPIKGKIDTDLPDLHPIKCTISLPKENVYTTETSFPLSNRVNCSHPHTIFTFFNKEVVGNIHGSGVSTTQFQSRTLLNAFAVAASRAKQLYGETFLDNIPKPIVVQSIQTDGRTFHFGVFQLNTMALGEAGDLKNYWFHETNIDLYTQCGYKHGRPHLEGYNSNVIRFLNAFYNNF